MTNLRHCYIRGYGSYLPEQQIKFDDNIRYRLSGTETHMSMTRSASESAINRAKISKGDIDCVVFASAIGFQAIPCSAALVHEQLGLTQGIPAFDINTTCTSFISALDIMSYMVDCGRYTNVLIVSSDVPSFALNPKQKESYELFSDCAAAIVLSCSNDPAQGVLASTQHTWSDGAHWTEIRGGLSLLPPQNYSEETKEEYMFDMDGKRILRFTSHHIPKVFKDFFEKSEIDINSIDMFIPHQASRALPMMMSRLGISQDRYVDWVCDYGNMVSASVPFVLTKLLEQNDISYGNKVVLCGTAAGFSLNILVLSL